MPLVTTGPDWREGFLFVGDQLAIDFVNTRLRVDGAPMELLGDWQAVVRWFRAARLIDDAAARRLQVDWTGTPEVRRTMRRLAEFRESLRNAIARIEAGRPPTRAFALELNRYLHAHPLRVQVTSEGGRMQRMSVLDTTHPDDLVAPLAEAAAALLVDVDPARVRQCEGCVAHFYDASRNGLRRWCSMRICGNRAKVSRYAKRQRKSSRSSSR